MSILPASTPRRTRFLGSAVDHGVIRLLVYLLHAAPPQLDTQAAIRELQEKMDAQAALLQAQ
ncbi:hypothetical protein C2S53_014488 [Perilla frutescens var. hirtella]|uniref:Uncharacterized protein n=1 Tax=Perilla frutescens var. hirtella TaxID=608512 RepID=A0AAD4IVQ4_PERFH|nr:hypothetical protein C2S53_014488 [Perilla frutescens var. hirtella]